MKTFRIIFALLRVPRLFASLLLFPLLGALIVVGTQLLLSGSALRQINKSQKESLHEEIKSEDKDWQFLRAILYGSGSPLPDPKLCIWTKPEESHKPEQPPSEECAPDRLDIALHVSEDSRIEPLEYLKMIKGNAQRLHICESCKPDLELFVSSQGNSTKAHSTYGLMLYALLLMDKELSQQFKELKIKREDLKDKLGDVFFFLPELKSAIAVSSLQISLVFILNITALVVISLWLGLRAHRKVLDYFSKSGALLPMVAATGKTPFYLALWGITALRVAVFLVASVPLLLVVLGSASEQESVFSTIGLNFWELAIWLIALLSSMSLATLIASISDLKGRHELLSVAYKIIPLFLSALGALVWASSFFATTESAGIFRSILSMLPIFGMGPIILAPVIQPKIYILLIHILSSAGLVWFLMRRNAHWFAAHLEEL